MKKRYSIVRFDADFTGSDLEELVLEYVHSMDPGQSFATDTAIPDGIPLASFLIDDDVRRIEGVLMDSQDGKELLIAEEGEAFPLRMDEFLMAHPRSGKRIPKEGLDEKQASALSAYALAPVLMIPDGFRMKDNAMLSSFVKVQADPGRRYISIHQEGRRTKKIITEEEGLDEKLHAALHAALAKASRRFFSHDEVSRLAEMRKNEAELDSRLHGEEIQGYIRMVEEAEEESARHRAERDEAMRDADILRATIADLKHQLERKMSTKGNSISLEFGEKEFYQGEVHDLVLSLIRKEATRRPASNCGEYRKYHLLASIAEANEMMHGARKIREMLERTLLDGRSISKRTIRNLESIGFSVDCRGKHPAICFNGDSRYTFTMPLTGSDTHSGMNLLKEIEQFLNLRDC